MTHFQHSNPLTQQPSLTICIPTPRLNSSIVDAMCYIQQVTASTMQTINAVQQNLQQQEQQQQQQQQQQRS